VVRPGRFAWTSTRNNNFSNRDQKGLICVRGTWKGTRYNCTAEKGSEMLQDVNIASSTVRQRATTTQDLIAANCYDSVGANSDGVVNCIGTKAGILKTQSNYIFGQDNDHFGTYAALVSG
jgi:hypothetical protein